MRSFTLNELLASRFNLLPTAVYDSFPAVLFGRLLVIATRNGVFDSLNDRSQTIEQLTDSLHLPRKSVELIITPLDAGGYLKRIGTRYSLTPQAKKWLVKSSPHYIGNFIAYIEMLHSHWMYLEETLRQGKPPESYVEMFGEDEWRIYTLGMMDLAKLVIPKIISKIKIPPDARTLIDLCGSHGLYTMELCRRHPNLRATIADFPEVLKTTQTIIEQHHLTDRINLLPRDVTRTTFQQESYDAALAFNIVHGFSEEANRTFMRSIASMLRPGGIAYILDQLKHKHSSGVDRMLPLMVGLNLLNEIGGNVYSFGDIKSWCQDAGLVRVRLHRVGLPGVSLVRAVKSEKKKLSME